jgi:hypothetical protein
MRCSSWSEGGPTLPMLRPTRRASHEEKCSTCPPHATGHGHRPTGPIQMFAFALSTFGGFSGVKGVEGVAMCRRARRRSVGERRRAREPRQCPFDPPPARWLARRRPRVGRSLPAWSCRVSCVADEAGRHALLSPRVAQVWRVDISGRLRGSNRCYRGWYPARDAGRSKGRVPACCDHARSAVYATTPLGSPALWLSR